MALNFGRFVGPECFGTIAITCVSFPWADRGTGWIVKGSLPMSVMSNENHRESSPRPRAHRRFWVSAVASPVKHTQVDCIGDLRDGRLEMGLSASETEDLRIESRSCWGWSDSRLDNPDSRGGWSSPLPPDHIEWPLTRS